MKRTCISCGVEVSDGAKRCRRCHRIQTNYDLHTPESVELREVPANLMTGTELLDKVWWRRQRVRHG